MHDTVTAVWTIIITIWWIDAKPCFFTLSQISSNGLLSFNSPITSYTPERFPTKEKIIAPFWTDLSTEFVEGCRSNISTIFYREYTQLQTDGIIFKDINSIVESSFYYRNISGFVSVPFITKWAFAVTWRQVPYHNDCGKVCIPYSIVPYAGYVLFSILSYLYNKIKII